MKNMLKRLKKEFVHLFLPLNDYALNGTVVNMKININENTIKFIRSCAISANSSYDNISTLVSKTKSIVNDLSNVSDAYKESLEYAFCQLENNVKIMSEPVKKISEFFNDYAEICEEIVCGCRLFEEGDQL